MSGEAEPAEYVPTLDEAGVARIRRWHEVSRALGQGRPEMTFEYLGLSLVVPPTVQPITPTSHLLGEAVIQEVRTGERVLDMGCGCGVNAILAARAGAEVVAVDINPDAIDATVRNARRNGTSDRVDVRQSDVFSAVPEVFDLIVIDPPFRWFKPRDLAEAATTDEGYRAMTTFFRKIRDHLTEDGRLLVFFGTSGDIGYLKNLMAGQGFSWSTVAHTAGERDGVPVEYFTFRLTA